ncbi:ribosome recycling factor [Hypoxylon argillaceum]|nr:ribosome recycling factor [Hypoxylon argillaceum]
MSNAAARTCLRQGFARSQTRGISYDVVRTSIVGVAAAPTYQRYSRSPLVSTPPRSPLDLPHSTRAFHTSPAVHKSKKKEDAGRGKSNGKHAESSSSSSSSASDSTEDGPKHPQPNPEEPLDFADVESRLTRHAEHFKAIFKKLHTGGRFDPDVVGALRVTVDRKAGDAYPLRELAQVVPRGGRAVSLLAHEAAYVKPIMSAVQASPEFNQQPQRDPDNELELVLRIEPERPEDLVRRAKAVANEWRDRVRSARQRRDKQHVTWKKEGALGPDLKRTADKELDKVIKAAMTEIDEVEKSAVKAAESK